MKKTIALFTLFICLSLNSFSQTKYATIRVVETDINNASGLIISYDDIKESEIIELESMKNSAVGIKKNLEILQLNQKKIHEAMNKVAEKGYTLVHTSSSGDSRNIYTTYTFIKD